MDKAAEVTSVSLEATNNDLCLKLGDLARTFAVDPDSPRASVEMGEALFGKLELPKALSTKLKSKLGAAQ